MAADAGSPARTRADAAAGGVYAGFQRELERLARRHARQPRKEMLSLFLLALEREELVSIGYRESIMAARLRDMPIEIALLSVGNVEWVGARCDEFLFIERQAQRATAVMMLLDEFPPHFALLDGYERAPDGLVGVMGSPSPRSPRRLYAGMDALAVDTVAARHLGICHPRESSILQSACHWFGGWSERIEVIGTDEPISDWRGPYDNEFWALLSFLAFPVYVMGSGRGSLFVPEMDEAAFPPLQRAGVFLRLGRRGIRRLLGLRHPRRGGEHPRPSVHAP